MTKLKPSALAEMASILGQMTTDLQRSNDLAEVRHEVQLCKRNLRVYIHECKRGANLHHHMLDESRRLFRANKRMTELMRF